MSSIKVTKTFKYSKGIKNFIIGGVALSILNHFFEGNDMSTSALLSVAPLSFFSLLLLSLINNYNVNGELFSYYSTLYIIPAWISILITHILLKKGINKAFVLISCIILWIVGCILVYYIS